jgi:dTDP-4-amino-4,6-dideoxygalactose transaminase
VGADVYYPLPVHRQAYIQELGLHAELPVTDQAAAETIALPIFPGLSEDEQATVVEAVRSSVATRAAAGRIGVAQR